MGLALMAFLAFDGWLIYKRVKYTGEIERLRGGMSETERRRADMIVAENENKYRVMLELIRRQAQGDKELHLAVAVDSGEMYLEREGAILREMRVDVGPEAWVHAGPDSVLMTAPRGSRTVERVLEGGDAWEVPPWVYAQRGLSATGERKLKGALGPVAIVLNGGTVIYSWPTVGPLNDSTYVLPGSVRAKGGDLRAVAPNVKPGMNVYFY